MPKELINANPVLYGKKKRQVRSESINNDEYAEEPIDQQEIFDHVRDIKDPEHPYSLEELNVVSEGSIEVNGKMNYVRITFTPTVEHCSMATIIGLCLRVKLMRSLPSRYKTEGISPRISRDITGYPGSVLDLATISGGISGFIALSNFLTCCSDRLDSDRYKISTWKSCDRRCSEQAVE